MTRLLTITAAAIGLLAAPAFAANLLDSHPHHQMKDVIVHPSTDARGTHTASTHVRYDDVDAGTPDGAKVLLSRIQAAAKKVCGPAPKGKISLHERSSYKSCVHEATENGVNSVNSPALSAIYQKEA